MRAFVAALLEGQVKRFVPRDTNMHVVLLVFKLGPELKLPACLTLGS